MFPNPDYSFKWSPLVCIELKSNSLKSLKIYHKEFNYLFLGMLASLIENAPVYLGYNLPDLKYTLIGPTGREVNFKGCHFYFDGDNKNVELTFDVHKLSVSYETLTSIIKAVVGDKAVSLGLASLDFELTSNPSDLLSFNNERLPIDLDPVERTLKIESLGVGIRFSETKTPLHTSRMTKL